MSQGHDNKDTLSCLFVLFCRTFLTLVSALRGWMKWALLFSFWCVCLLLVRKCRGTGTGLPISWTLWALFSHHRRSKTGRLCYKGQSSISIVSQRRTRYVRAWGVQAHSSSFRGITTSNTWHLFAVQHPHKSDWRIVFILMLQAWKSKISPDKTQGYVLARVIASSGGSSLLFEQNMLAQCM